MKKVLKYLTIKALLLGVLMALCYSCEEEMKLDPAKDWPQFKKDNYRSANAAIQLDLASLGEDWQYTAPQMPVPAWYGPAKEDTYARSGPLPSMRDYDLSYYPIVVGNKLYYGSTADNAIHCLDSKTGKELWTFTTGGPIRVAPVFYQGKLLFGSDDGYAYCIKATSGKLVWKYSPVAEQPKKVINNNALISFWPIRTGVLIEDNIAYFGASLLPWKDSYFCAVNVKTGKPQGTGTYIKTYENLTLEGAMASTGSKIIQPQGRISPIFFDKNTGESKGQLAGTGGCFVLVTPEKNIVHPNNTRAKGIAETLGEFASVAERKDKKNADYMSFKDGKEMVVSGDFSYILTDNSISAYDRKTKKVVWLKRNYKAHRIVISGDVLYVGATDKVYAVSTKNGFPLWVAPVKGAVYALTVADNALFASTGEGHIYCFRSGKGENSLLAENANKPANVDEVIKKEEEPETVNLELEAGPFVTTIGPNSVEIAFVTKDAINCEINWGDDSGKKRINEKKTTKNHRIVINDVRKDFIYEYQIIAGDSKSAYYEFDNFFNYESHDEPVNDNSEKSALVKEIETLKDFKKGIAVVFGTKNKEKALEIASVTGIKVMLFDTSESDVQKLREEIQATGIYGSKIAVHHVNDLSHLPITSDIANIVLVNKTSGCEADEVIRIVKPEGYALLDKTASNFDNWLSKATNMWQVTYINEEGYGKLRKAPYETAGKWTHQYGLADNSAFGGESLWGSTGTDDFEIQWMGRPGPRFQTDRSGRKPSPLAVDGKMFVQGRERIVAVDAYNGNVLWSKELPGLNRMNIHRDCSNWVADDDFVYAAIKQNLIKINNKNGAIDAIIPVEQGNQANIVNDWGYVSVKNNLVVGSATPKASAYTNYYGGDGWYDSQSGPLSDKVVSYNIFAKDKNTLKPVWIYEKPSSFIINSTITISGNTMSFVESRNKRFKLSKDNRADPSIFNDLYMVSLNVVSGKINWEKPINTASGVTTYFMAGGSDFNVLLASAAGKYYIYNYSTTTGDLVWNKEQNWFSGDHGGHLSKPAIVNNRLIVKPAMYQLDTGDLLKEEVPKAGHGCASYALSEQSAFYRGGSVTQFNFETNKFSQWERLRPDCWISTIPAQGLVLSPEAGGGCSCGNWLETSMVFTPKSRAPITFIYKDEKFVDTLKVEIKAKNSANGAVYYTLDGSEPTMASNLYTQPIVITETTDLKAVVYVNKNDEKVAFTRTKTFTRVYPEPKIVETPQLIDENWVFYIERIGQSGTVHYTVDGSSPSLKSPKFDGPVPFSEKTLVKAKTIWKNKGKLIESKETSFEIQIPNLIANVETEVEQGVSRAYYKGNGKTNELPKLDDIKAVNAKIVSDINATDFANQNTFALRFKGYVNIPVDGMYTFSSKSTRSYDFVSFHNMVELQSKGNAEVSKVLPLKKGLHPLLVDHFVGEGPSDYSLYIEGPKLNKQLVSESMLFH
ncbi:outer membrane protein assembly factor BamB family protein [Snuella sedimenti]|uniref:PQQ-binding-like beta-propeller repeat protein n=1 Tax=Snuella sedimenti TaxID=2798802 RepID=A0A8J7LTZ5_9FLAO|nr:PQQ-binding-like beta-propeller repeat protein [Snuella sedimenti]MBJ6368961.1 PQQ-binding-like beta-propeller repeat protein [Snuella sedimenti]